MLGGPLRGGGQRGADSIAGVRGSGGRLSIPISNGGRVAVSPRVVCGPGRNSPPPRSPGGNAVVVVGGSLGRDDDRAGTRCCYIFPEKKPLSLSVAIPSQLACAVCDGLGPTQRATVFSHAGGRRINRRVKITRQASYLRHKDEHSHREILNSRNP